GSGANAQLLLRHVGGAALKGTRTSFACAARSLAKPMTTLKGIAAEGAPHRRFSSEIGVRRFYRLALQLLK
ncbi:MAG: hypothetical protein ABJB17_11860, partial [Burkholderiales bacterium]